MVDRRTESRGKWPGQQLRHWDKRFPRGRCLTLDPRHQFQDAYWEAQAAVRRSDPARLAAPAGAEFLEREGALRIRYMGGLYKISVRDCTPVPVGDSAELSFEEAILVLQYVTGASGLPPRGTWLSFLELPGGPHHDALFRKEAIAPLASAFGQDPGRLLEAAKPFGGEPLPMADAAVRIPVFPRLPLAFLVWKGDEEFSPRANLLFDSVSVTCLPTASLYVLGIVSSNRLCSAHTT